MKRVRVGIIGYGLRGEILGAACRRSGEIEVAAVCDGGEAARKKARIDFPKARIFGDYPTLLQKGKIDAVLIETPPDTHAVYAIAALTQGIHVLCDVPAVHLVSEAPRLWDAVRKSAAVYMMGATTNYWAFVDTCRDLLGKGLLGRPFYCEADYVADLGDMTRKTPWRRYYEPIRYCTHSLGPVLKWLDEDLTTVSCFDSGNHAHEDPQEHDAMVAIFRTPSRILVKLLISFINAHPVPYHRYLFQGTRGYFERTQPVAGGGQQVLFSSREIYGMNRLTALPVCESRPEMPSGIGEHGGADDLMIRDFLASITAGTPVSIDVREALRMTLPGLFALESARNGGEPVPIHYPWNREGENPAATNG